MAWTVEYSDTALKQLKKLDKSVARRVINYLDARVVDDPRAFGKPLKGGLGELWRYRVGDIRILCDIQDERLIVLVAKVGHRKQVYS